MPTPFPYAFSFHGFSDSAIAEDVLVGGAETSLFRQGVSEVIRDYLRSVGGTALTTRYNLVGPTYDDYDGDSSANFVNRLAVGGRGLQIEQGPKIRIAGTAGYDADYHVAVADAVKSVYDCLVDSADVTTQVTSKPSSVSAPGTSYELTGKCPRWIADFNVTANLGNVHIDVSKGISATCSGDAHIDIYRKRDDGTWDRIGGGRKRYINILFCDVSHDTGYQFVNSAATPGQFRVVVRASPSLSTALPSATIY